MSLKILITGGAGFIGSNFIHYMIQHYPDYSIHVFDKLTYAGNKSSLPDCIFNDTGKQYTLTEACVTDRKKIADAVIGADVIVHFASESHVTNS